jgi:hypothetical protein
MVGEHVCFFPLHLPHQARTPCNAEPYWSLRQKEKSVNSAFIEILNISFIHDF